MANLFQSFSLRRPKRTAFDLSYSNKLSVDFGRLTPMLMEKTIPGDKFYISDEFLCRFAPFFGQVFQAMKLRTEYFYVPSRILWKNFEMFLANGINGTTDTYVHPYIDMKTIWANFEFEEESLLNSLFDYFNISSESIDASTIGTDFHIDALPFYAYCKTFIDYYADENLDYLPLVQAFESGLEYAIDGDNTQRIMNLLAYLHNPAKFSSFADFLSDYNANQFNIDYSIADVFSPLVRSYPKDYFTSALPFAQRGPIVQIPLNGEGDVKVYSKGLNHAYTSYRGVGVNAPASSTNAEQEVTLYEYGAPVTFTPVNDDPDLYGASFGQADYDSLQPKQLIKGPSEDNPAITFKAVNINGTATITDLRTAIAVQNWLEKRARSGVRAKEQIYASFGVKSKDYRLDRSEFISAFSSTVKIGEVFTTAQNDDGSFVPGLGVSVGQLADKSRRWKKSMPEHGYCFGLVSLYPVATYYQGVPRQFLELDIMDYYWPEFQHIGEQPIFNCELKIDEVSNNYFGTFGYTPRYSHYKTRTDQIHGDFRDSLQYMVAARRFNSLPTLSNDFVQFRPAANGLYRIFNATGEWKDANPCYIDVFHHFKAVRPMSYFGNPRLI